MLTFSKRNTGQQVRFQRKQTDITTPARTSQRDFFAVGLSWWRMLTGTEKQTWLGIGSEDY